MNHPSDAAAPEGAGEWDAFRNAPFVGRGRSRHREFGNPPLYVYVSVACLRPYHMCAAVGVRSSPTAGTCAPWHRVALVSVDGV